jgi:hypothetical protein
MGIVNQFGCVPRRGFWRLLAAGAAWVRWPGSRAHADRLAWNVKLAPDLNLERRYRADATVLLLGVPVLHRDAVGAGSVIWREFDAGATRLLEFNGFSSPERAAGLNRLGFIRELRRTGHSDDCIYFGLMTASPEESSETARKALHSTAKEQAYTAIEGRIGAGRTEPPSPISSLRQHYPASARPN